MLSPFNSRKRGGTGARGTAWPAGTGGPQQPWPPALAHGSGTRLAWPPQASSSHSEWPAEEPSEQTPGFRPSARSRGAQTPQARSCGSRGRTKGAGARGSCLRGVPFEPEPTARGYLHDGLSKVPDAPVTEAGLRRGRDEALMSGGVIRVISGLPGVQKGAGGEQKQELPRHSQVTCASNSSHCRQKAGSRLVSTIVPVLLTLLCPGDQGALSVRTGDREPAVGRRPSQLGNNVPLGPARWPGLSLS